MVRWSVDEHVAHIAELLAPALKPSPETVTLDEALDRVIASAVASPVDLPLFRNSQMDGFAVRSADLATMPTTLMITGEVAARPSNPLPLLPGSTVRIMTGGVMPPGADTVIPVEEVTVDEGRVSITQPRRAGDFVRDRGSDIRCGAQLLPSGKQLASRHLAVLAAAGLATVEVLSRVRVAVITTGSELVEPGHTPVLGQVFDSNGTALAAAVRAAGAQLTFRAQVHDDTATMIDALKQAAATADLILTSGGISMGAHEVVRETLEPLGARVGQVAMQPGGPQATAMFEGIPVMCFPGNPVSTQLSFEIFVAPLLRQVAGLAAAQRSWRALVGSAASPRGTRQFLRARAVDHESVALVAGSGSHLVAGLAASDLLVVVPEEVTQLSAGDSVETWEL
ncbi:MAG: molybdopterin molybdotransferase MoeA [Rhodoglobus sp.]